MTIINFASFKTSSQDRQESQTKVELKLETVIRNLSQMSSRCLQQHVCVDQDMIHACVDAEHMNSEILTQDNTNV